jgi:hypothetical protein
LALAAGNASVAFAALAGFTISLGLASRFKLFCKSASTCSALARAAGEDTRVAVCLAAAAGGGVNIHGRGLPLEVVERERRVSQLRARPVTA